MSGMLLRDGQEVIIGVNSSHAPTRQRFTIAHELGHLLMHEGQAVFLDASVRFRVDMRNKRSGVGDPRQERQANQFAAFLLMPADLLEIAVKRAMKADAATSAESLVQLLAQRFAVSSEAMRYRLIDIGTVGPD